MYCSNVSVRETHEYRQGTINITPSTDSSYTSGLRSVLGPVITRLGHTTGIKGVRYCRVNWSLRMPQNSHTTRYEKDSTKAVCFFAQCTWNRTLHFINTLILDGASLPPIWNHTYILLEVELRINVIKSESWNIHWREDNGVWIKDRISSTHSVHTITAGQWRMGGVLF